MTLICRNTPSCHQLWDSSDWVVQSKQSRVRFLRAQVLFSRYLMLMHKEIQEIGTV